jgi:Fibronectin type III domain
MAASYCYYQAARSITVTPGHTQATVSWLPPLDQTGSPITSGIYYSVQYAKTSNLVWQSVATVSNTSLVITGLSVSTTYQVNIVVTDKV